MAGWALFLAIIALLVALYAQLSASDAQKDTDEHNTILKNLIQKLKEKKIIEE